MKRFESFDAIPLLDHLGVADVDVVGYSMGSVVSSRVVPMEPRARRLVLVGDNDTLVGPPGPLADAIPDASVTVVSGDHLTAVGDPAFPKAIVDFLA